ncbi:hypothetical protein BGZ83_005410 [Gryganskiella cystojenkinii]|nr:hypothetical protein BGZ83_005410 [Gryganskiella cystojenkinii]
MNFLAGTALIRRTTVAPFQTNITHQRLFQNRRRVIPVSGTITQWYSSSTNSEEVKQETSPCCHKKSVVPKADQEQSKSCHKTQHPNQHKPKLNSSALSAGALQFWSDPKTWKIASTNTFRCLIGCTLGDLSMLFYLQTYHPALSPPLAMGLAMTSGILTSITLETLILRYSSKVRMPWSSAFKTATGMSMISMLTMEAVENGVDYHLMGWGNVNISDPMFWNAIGWSALAGWSTPLPFNYWNLKRHGKSCH